MGKRGNVGNCKLCGRRAELRESHVFPKFVIRWISQTGDRFLRNAVEPNIRQQDGPKRRMLCDACEQRFSSREKYFAESLFRPILDAAAGPFAISYDERAMYFLISLLWRRLSVTLDKTDIDHGHCLPVFQNTEQVWRAYLLEEEPLDTYNNVHMFVTGIPAQTALPVPKLTQYMTRALDGTVMRGREFCGVFMKFSRFVVFGLLTPYDEAEWINTRISVVGGRLTLPQEIRDPYIGKFLIERATTGNMLIESHLTELQKTLIAQRVDKEGPRLFGSDLGRAILADLDREVEPFAFGTKVGRNEKCPCGSNKKFKSCHGRKR